MNTQIGRALTAMVFTGLTAASYPAQAQMVHRWRVDLPVEVQWGETVVGPGQHTITLRPGALDRNILQVSGDQQVVNVLASRTGSGISSHSSLTLEKINGRYVVRRFDAGTVGKSFVIPVSKKTRREMSVRRKNTTVTIPAAGF